MKTAAVLGLAYLIGCVPFGWLVHRLRTGADIRQEGSGNIGATNVLRVMGPAAALITLVGDVGKGMAAVLVGRAWGGFEDADALCGLAALVGHVFPVTLGFRGGKGVATGVGAFVLVAPWPTLAAMGVFLLVLVATRYVSVASLAAAGFLAACVPLTQGWGLRPVAVMAGALLVAVRHRENLRRLRLGTEARLGTGRVRGDG
jgi:glycerol-3-phosphate acyltransferase PlsY